MQKIYLEKLIDLDHQMSELLSIAVDESLNYKIEENGMRAQGRIDINGEYLKTASKERFNEFLEVDILAPFEKISDQHDFNIKIEDFDYKIQSGNLLVTIEAIVYGVQTSEDRFYSDDELREDKEEEVLNDEAIIEEIKEAISSPEPVVIKEVEPIQEVKQERDPSLDDLIEISDQSDLVPYYIYVATDQDDYDTISTRYHVPAAVIRDYNHDIPVSGGTLIIVPYYEP